SSTISGASATTAAWSIRPGCISWACSSCAGANRRSSTARATMPASWRHTSRSILEARMDMKNPGGGSHEQRFGFDTLAVHPGQAAQHIALFSLMDAGDEFIASSTLYGGTINQFDVTFRKVGIEPTFVKIGDLDGVRRAITPKTKCVFAETLGNPKIDVLDIE